MTCDRLKQNVTQKQMKNLPFFRHNLRTAWCKVLKFSTFVSQIYLKQYLIHWSLYSIYSELFWQISVQILIAPFIYLYYCSSVSAPKAFSRLLVFLIIPKINVSSDFDLCNNLLGEVSPLVKSSDFHRLHFLFNVCPKAS